MASRLLLALVLAAMLGTARTASAEDLFQAENTATTAVGGGSFDIAAFLGAGSYHTNPDLPLSGQNTVAYNVEAGHIWNGHEALQHVTTFLNSPGTYGGGAVEPLYDRHATWAAMLLGGRGNGELKQTGLAPGTDLRSAAIATGWSGNAYALSFGISAQTYVAAFANAFAEADVLNSSFGYTDPGGTNVLTIFTDALVFQNPATTYVVSAGNSGAGANTVGAPGSGYNTITVGALGSANAFNSVASFSSRGPQDFSYFNASINGTTTVAGVRAAVDISAPGESLTSAFYGGQTGGNNPTLAGSVDLGSNPAAYSSSISGTSFAAPIVAGGAALVASASKTLPELAGNEEALSNLVVKSLLLTGADKTSGWSNGQSLVNGVVTTTQSLDYAVGAGRMNLATTFQTQVRGQAGVAGTSTGLQGSVQELGWDFGRAVNGISNDYILADPLVGNSSFTTTLSWHRVREWDPFSGTLFETAQADLNLSLWRLGENNAFETLVARSTSLYNPVEHLSFTIPENGLYGLRVSYDGNTFANFAAWGSADFPQTYGLAWNGEAFSTLGWRGGSGEWNGIDPVWSTSANGTSGTARSATSPYSTLVLDTPGNQTVVVAGARQAAGLVLKNGTADFSGNASPSLAIGTGGIHLASTADGPASFGASLPISLSASQRWSNASSQNLVIDGSVLGSGDLEIEATSTGAVVLNGIHSRAGNTTITEGRVIVNGDLSANALVTVSSGGSLGGAGRVGNLILEQGGTLSPGNSPGSLFVDGDAVWNGGGHYNWEVHLANPDAADQSLAGSAWDFLDITGTLSLVGVDTGANRFRLNLWSLSSLAPDVSGPVSGFDPAIGSTWLIARAAGGISLNSFWLEENTDYTGYFDIRTAAANGTGGWIGPLPAGGFRILTLEDAGSLYLFADPVGVPEPRQWAAALLVCLLAAYTAWRNQTQKRVFYRRKM